MENILNSVSEQILRKIYKVEDAKFILKMMGIVVPKNETIWNVIIQNWDYEKFKNITRKIAIEEGGKYDKNNYQLLLTQREVSIQKYKEEFGDKYEWVFGTDYDGWRKKYSWGQITFDEYLTGCKKNGLAADIADKTSKLTEMFLVSMDENVFPTLINKKGIDYFYKGKSRDWKNAKSIGKKFIEQEVKKGNDPYVIAQSNPELVAKWLYENQSEDRWGDESRHFIINLNDTLLSNDEFIEKLKTVEFDKHYVVEFYRKKTQTFYKTEALVSYI
jgi:hypothetical protein